MKKERKLMAPKQRYFGTEDERAEIAAKYHQGKALTLDECSKVMGLSRSAIKAIECRALSKLKKALIKEFGPDISLADFVDVSRGRQCATMIQVENDE